MYISSTLLFMPTGSRIHRAPINLGNLLGNVRGNLRGWQSSRKYEGCQHCRYLELRELLGLNHLQQ
jgi:hypothetical protein